VVSRRTTAKVVKNVAEVGVGVVGEAERVGMNARYLGALLLPKLAGHSLVSLDDDSRWHLASDHAERLDAAAEALGLVGANACQRRRHVDERSATSTGATSSENVERSARVPSTYLHRVDPETGEVFEPRKVTGCLSAGATSGTEEVDG
jgi:hypothetical protein